MAVENALGYYNTATIVAVKSFILLARRVAISSHMYKATLGRASFKVGFCWLILKSAATRPPPLGRVFSNQW